MNDYLTHKTTDGDRWDVLALRYYGDPLHVGPLLKANPYLASLPILPPNVTVRVPIIDRSELVPEPEPVVAWR